MNSEIRRNAQAFNRAEFRLDLVVGRVRAVFAAAPMFWIVFAVWLVAMGCLWKMDPAPARSELVLFG